MTRPLAGIRVLELGNFIAGPFCGMLLADMGADVLKIEPPGGDMTRATPPLVRGESAGFLSINRNKRSLALDLKQPQAVEIVLGLAAVSDVVVENYRPGVLDGLGLSAERLRSVNPGLVYTSVSGFGQTGPYRRRAAVNLIVEAASGMLSVAGEPGQVPMRLGIQVADVLGALFATYAVLSGLAGRLLHPNEGRTIDVSMLEASVAAAMWETSTYLASGEVPAPLGRRHRITAPYQLFQTADGYLAIGAPNDRLFERLLRVLGLDDLVGDPRYASVALRKAHDLELAETIEARTRTRASAELEPALEAAGVPCARVLDYGQVFDDPHVQARRLLVEVEHPRAGPGRMVRNPVLLDADGPGIDRPAPLLGQHSREVLAEVLDYAPERIEALVQQGVVFTSPCSGG